MDREHQRQKLIEGNRGITAFTKLLGQIGILDERIREHVRLAYGSPDHRRHAFDKPDGDTYSGFGFGPDFGPVLKAGSGRKEGKGYFHDRDEYWRLLQDHDVVARGSILMPSSLSQPVITESMTRRFTGRSDASTNEGTALSDGLTNG